MYSYTIMCIYPLHCAVQKHRTAIHKAVSKNFSTLKYLVEEIGLDPNLPDVVRNYIYLCYMSYDYWICQYRVPLTTYVHIKELKCMDSMLEMVVLVSIDIYI